MPLSWDILETFTHASCVHLDYVYIGLHTLHTISTATINKQLNMGHGNLQNFHFIGSIYWFLSEQPRCHKTEEQKHIHSIAYIKQTSFILTCIYLNSNQILCLRCWGQRKAWLSKSWWGLSNQLEDGLQMRHGQGNSMGLTWVTTPHQSPSARICVNPHCCLSGSGSREAGFLVSLLCLEFNLHSLR